MLEETLGKNERRATAVVQAVLVVETLWVFLHRYLPLDAPLWALQSEVVRAHLSGAAPDGWKMISIPAANTLLPFALGLLRFVFSSEVVVRLALAVVGIYLRGTGALVLFRVMRVRDEAIYYLIPVIIYSSIWFTGALPYLAAETALFYTLAYLVSQNHPRGNAYWLIMAGFLLSASLHALVFVAAIPIVLLITKEQRRTVHLSQGWLSSTRAVLGLLLPGLAAIAMTFFTRIPIFQLSSGAWLPKSGLSALLFMCTPVPSVLEAMLRGTSVFQLLIAGAVVLMVLGSLLRAIMLAMEEVTWQSRALKSAAYFLLLLAFAGIWLHSIGIDTFALTGLAVLLVLAASYSRGPAVRRTMLDRVLLVSSLVAMIVTGVFNSFSINRGSEAASEVLKRARALMLEERASAREDEHVDSLRMYLAIDSQLVTDQSSGLEASFSYGLSAAYYLPGDAGLLTEGEEFQPAGGILRPVDPNTRKDPTEPIQLSVPEAYLDRHVRVLAILPIGAVQSAALGFPGLSIQDPLGGPFNWGAAKFSILAGALTNQPVKSLASAN